MGHKGELACLSVFLVQKRSCIVPFLCEGKRETSHTPRRGNGHVPIPNHVGFAHFWDKTGMTPPHGKKIK